ncbi:expressed protein [Echinococcus multilocularis]|uniref:Expressed protein n=1 Tax=Echinococcus multilocularis TaxID=6211 RepID=A0A068Y7I1_ECHMU|nr:expressed protein [Echinococcus multilocularis]
MALFSEDCTKMIPKERCASKSQSQRRGLRPFLIWICERTKRNRILRWLSPFHRQKKMRRGRLGVFTGD